MRGIAIAVGLTLLALGPAARADDQGPASARSEVAFPLRVDELRIGGLVRTAERVVRRELGFREGDVITRADLDLAITRLWNTTIFAHVDADVIADGPRRVVVLTLEDRWTLNPLFRFQSGGNTFFFRLGAADNNVAGRLLEAQAQYEYFAGFHGGQALFRDPRLFDQRVELRVQAERLTRPRPGFSDQRTQATVELAKLFGGDRLRVALRASAFADRFLAPLDGPRYFPDATETLLLEPSFRLGRVDTVRLRQSGASLELRPGAGFSSSDVAEQFAQMSIEALGFLRLGERWNLAARVRGADVGRVPPHLALYAGGLDLVRGFPDNYVRTRALALANVELRLVAFDSTWIALMPVAFVDAAAARSPSGSAGTALSAGAGLRVLVPKFVGTGLRVDLAVPIAASLRGVSEAEQARLGPVTPAASTGSVQPSLGIYQFF